MAPTRRQQDLVQLQLHSVRQLQPQLPPLQPQLPPLQSALQWQPVMPEQQQPGLDLFRQLQQHQQRQPQQGQQQQAQEQQLQPAQGQGQQSHPRAQQRQQGQQGQGSNPAQQQRNQHLLRHPSQPKRASFQLLQSLSVTNLATALAAQPLLDSLLWILDGFASIGSAAGLPSDLRFSQTMLVNAAAWLLQLAHPEQAALSDHPQEIALARQPCCAACFCLPGLPSCGICVLSAGRS